MNVIFPEEFVVAARSLLPRHPTLHHYIQSGLPRHVGKILEAVLSTERIPAKEILWLIDEGKIQELRAMAERIVRIGELYTMWSRLPREPTAPNVCVNDAH